MSLIRKHIKKGVFGAVLFLTMVLSSPIHARATTYIVGDSRTVGMYMAIGSVDGVVFVSKSGSGYAWMTKDALPMFEENLQEGDNIVIAMGVNDTRGFFPSQYVSFLEKYVKNHPDCRVFYVSLNPVDEDDEKAVIKNCHIDSWNEHIQENLPENVTYINTNDNIAFTYADWLHYDTETNKAVYEYIISFVEGWGAEAENSEGETVLDTEQETEAVNVGTQASFDLDAYLEFHKKREEKKRLRKTHSGKGPLFRMKE